MIIKRPFCPDVYGSAPPEPPTTWTQPRIFVPLSALAGKRAGFGGRQEQERISCTPLA
jgi:hypothetical protein